MIEDIRSKPVLRLLSGLICGLALNITGINRNVLIITLLILLLVVWAGYSFRLVNKPGKEWINGLLIFASYLVMGILLKSVSTGDEKLKGSDMQGTYLARVHCYPLYKGQTYRAELRILNSDFTDHSHHNYHVLVYFKNSDSTLLPGISDIIIFRGELCTPEPPQNPGEFDYASYLRSKGISFTCFLDPDDWIIAGRDRRFSSEASGLRIRQMIWEKISAVQSDNPDLDILYALTLGSKDLLDRETKEAFISAGTMHVLAVSGLHVGLIYLVLSSILIFIKRLPSGRVLYFIIILSFLWLYAMITGLSPSVVRSVIMFSLVILGKTLQKETSVYNSVYLAGFISLIFSPSWLYEPGFQLSYSAVLAIVFFQPRISSFYFFKNRLMKWVWELTAVSIAAQLGTLPVSLYYFHRFPPYFLFSNLVVIPIVTIILAGFVVQLLCIFIPPVFSLVSNLVIFLTGILDGFVKIIHELPSPGFESIFIQKGQMWLLILLILSVVLFILYRQKFWVIITLFLIILFVSISNFYIFRRNTRDYFIVYNSYSDFAVGMYSRGRGILLVNSDKPEGVEERTRQKCDGFHAKHHISSYLIIQLDDLDDNRKNAGFVEFVKLPGKNNVIFWFMGKKIIFLCDPSYYNNRRSCGKIVSDLIVLGGKAKIKEESFIGNFSGKTVIFSSSIPAYIDIDDFEIFSFDAAVEFHDVRCCGAWMTDQKTDNQIFKRIQNYLKSLGIL